MQGRRDSCGGTGWLMGIYNRSDGCRWVASGLIIVIGLFIVGCIVRHIVSPIVRRLFSLIVGTKDVSAMVDLHEQRSPEERKTTYI